MDPFSWTYFLVQVLVSVALAVAASMLTRNPKSDKAEAGKLDSPTASDAKPIPVVFGTVEVKAPNCLYFGEISTVTKKVK